MPRCSVLIVVGSKSDLDTMEEARKTLEGFGVSSELVVASAHRQPAKVRELAARVQEGGADVVIAGAGMAAHLAGTLASLTTVPVIGVPLLADSFGALDSLLSTVQMPAGVPVAVVSAGKAGAVNAAVLAVEILSLKDGSLKPRLSEYRKKFSS
ncbi:MAG: 5-(carboxyamino)imidazole ribonucleotide mutase [Candidatus Eiseniibacteriota bacterium]|nr:MAG: 5-(carboxyamino)imidazole ribonucleotide mutase [Candidatus Eisenbacteria bacterium]